MTNNKNHWYDGWLYDKIVAPNQDKLFGQIKDLIEPGSNVIDVGCGTGRLEFSIADKCKFVLGIDLSKRNIDRALLTLIKNPNDKISFQHSNISEISNEGQTRFDYAVITFVIHEVDEAERLNFINDTASVADKIIVGDYLVPRPVGIEGYVSETIEFIAGREHYRNFKSYVAGGGIYTLAHRAGLRVINEITNQHLSNHIVILAK